MNIHNFLEKYKNIPGIIDIYLEDDRTIIVFVIHKKYNHKIPKIVIINDCIYTTKIEEVCFPYVEI